MAPLGTLANVRDDADPKLNVVAAGKPNSTLICPADNDPETGNVKILSPMRDYTPYLDRPASKFCCTSAVLNARL